MVELVINNVLATAAEEAGALTGASRTNKGTKLYTYSVEPERVEAFNTFCREAAEANPNDETDKKQQKFVAQLANLAKEHLNSVDSPKRGRKVDSNGEVVSSASKGKYVVHGTLTYTVNAVDEADALAKANELADRHQGYYKCLEITLTGEVVKK